MKERLFTAMIILAVVIPGGCSVKKYSAADQEIAHHLDSLLENKDVFKAGRYFESEKQHISESDRLIARGKLENFSFHPAQSNRAISKLLKKHNQQINDSLRCALLQIMLQNKINLFQYREAAGLSSELIRDYAGFLDSTRLADLKNEHQIWAGLRNAPPQAIVKNGNTDLKLIQGSLMPVHLNDCDSGVNLIFDTGANFCVLIESLAQSMHMHFLDATFKVNSILGNEITARLALADKLRTGNITADNAVFLILPDSALYFPTIDYQIYGIIGFPFIAALEQITLTRDGHLIVPEKPSGDYPSNLALDFLTPLIEVISDHDSMVFTFDTGAGNTWLYKRYYYHTKSKGFVSSHDAYSS